LIGECPQRRGVERPHVKKRRTLTVNGHRVAKFRVDTLQYRRSAMSELVQKIPLTPLVERRLCLVSELI
jgi:hypothetical protein